MSVTDKLERKLGQVRQHRAEGKVDHLQRENLELETEARTLRDEIRDDRAELANVVRALQSSSATGKPRHRVRRLLTLTVVAVGAYTLGAKAGRHRYERIRAAAHKVLRGSRSAVDEVRDRSDDAIDEAQALSDRLSDAGQVIGETVKTMAEGRSTA